MADVQVTCIITSQWRDSYKAITHLGGSNWRWPKADVIASIKNKTNTFYTQVDGNRANIGIVQDPDGEYLRTHADGKWNDNLLALKQCPVT